MQNYIGLIHTDADSDFGVSFPDFPGSSLEKVMSDPDNRTGATVLVAFG